MEEIIKTALIADSRNTGWFFSLLQGALTLGKRYDLSRLERGTYQLYLTSEEKSYTHNFLVQ